jgi:squalene-hopene/tetraprenyl-beta-curcumene cyclase
MRNLDSTSISGSAPTFSDDATAHAGLVVPPPGAARLDDAVARARDALIARQDLSGFWRAELEGDTTLESYMILVEAFFGRRQSERALALARTIRDEQLPGGGWSQYPGGPADVSVSCLSYFALKVVGDPEAAPHMRRAAAAIVALGGVARANTYTKYHLAFFGQVRWQDVPAIPPEMIFLPSGAPFSVYDMSSWSRAIFVPLSILWAKKPVRPVPFSCGVDELWVDGAAPPPAPASSWDRLFAVVDRGLKSYERLPGVGLARAAAVDRATEWMLERLEDSDGLGAILPAMTSPVLALRCLGYSPLESPLREALEALDGLLLTDELGALRVQPCLSPVWDTVLTAHALAQAGVPAEHPSLRRAASWLLGKQTRRTGDWAARNHAPPGGWYFEARNEFYPDVDDTCMALMVLRQARAQGDGPDSVETQERAIRRGLTWLLGMQNRDGGWGSFDRDNDKRWLTHVPFADHNAMIDPSTADITARVLECLSYFPEFGPWHPVVLRATHFLRRDQSPEGAWYGRWGVNYIYGTWQTLRGLARSGQEMDSLFVRRAVRWLMDHQNADGGWGESIASYDDPGRMGLGATTPTQTAWAVMGLIAAGQAQSAAVRSGIGLLLETQTADGTWPAVLDGSTQAAWTGTGFPKVFYLHYHSYQNVFPLMALGQYASATGRRPGARPEPPL